MSACDTSGLSTALSSVLVRWGAAEAQAMIDKTWIMNKLYFQSYDKSKLELTSKTKNFMFIAWIWLLIIARETICDQLQAIKWFGKQRCRLINGWRFRNFFDCFLGFFIAVRWKPDFGALSHSRAEGRIRMFVFFLVSESHDTNPIMNCRDRPPNVRRFDFEKSPKKKNMSLSQRRCELALWALFFVKRSN